MRRWVPLFAALALLMTAAPAAAETFTVTTTADGGGLCSGTSCPSIRSAVNAAVNTGEADRIMVPPGQYGLDQGALQITTPVTIDGAGMGATRVFAVGSSHEVFIIGAPVTVTISNLTMAEGFGGWGGNLVNTGTLTLDHIRSTSGDASSGGGMANVGGTLTVTHSVIDDNESLRGGGDSGGIANINPGANLTVRHSTIAGNRSKVGGGIFAWGNPGSTDNITTRLEHVTVAGNQALEGAVGGAGNGVTGGFTVRASVLVGNTDVNGISNCGANLPVSEGANVVATAECGFAAAGDVVADPQLGAFDGAVYPLAPTSPAVDRAGACTGTDQRDLARPQGTACDSGAYELAQAPPSGPRPSQDPQPEFKETVVVDEVSGTVKVRLAGTNRFVSLDSVRDVPMGSEIDARKGVVELVSVAREDGAPQTARFSEGIFRVSQSGAVTVLTLTEKLSCAKAGKASIAAKKAKKRRLWGDGKGRFRTKGKHSAATVVGTKWLVADTCTTTLTRVVRGKVKVRDFVKRKTVTVKAGGRYTARQRKNRR